MPADAGLRVDALRGRWDICPVQDVNDRLSH
jgi:hypothetical protein